MSLPITRISRPTTSTRTSSDHPNRQGGSEARFPKNPDTPLAAPAAGHSLLRHEDAARSRIALEVAGLIDGEWPAKLPAALAERLQLILDDPEG